MQIIRQDTDHKRKGSRSLAFLVSLSIFYSFILLISSFFLSFSLAFMDSNSTRIFSKSLSLRSTFSTFLTSGALSPKYHELFSLSCLNHNSTFRVILVGADGVSGSVPGVPILATVSDGFLLRKWVPRVAGPVSLYSSLGFLKVLVPLNSLSLTSQPRVNPLELAA
jgi:hypothetical protein